MCSQENGNLINHSCLCRLRSLSAAHRQHAWQTHRETEQTTHRLVWSQQQGGQSLPATSASHATSTSSARQRQDSHVNNEVETQGHVASDGMKQSLGPEIIRRILKIHMDWGVRYQDISKVVLLV